MNVQFRLSPLWTQIHPQRSLMGMRCFRVVALAGWLVGCNGIAIGGSEGSEGIACPNTDQPIDDPSMPVSGFDRSADELLAAGTGRFDGMLHVRGARAFRSRSRCGCCATP
jgi:hypothetical protein